MPAPCKTIQQAVDNSLAGAVIAVAAGTYPEPAAGPLTINKTLTLCGAQAGMDARTRAAAESIITDSQGTSITASGVVIDGFTIQDSTNNSFTGFGLEMGATTSGTQVYNNIIQNNIAGIGLANAGAAPPQVLICQNLIQNNNQSGPSSGDGIYTDQFVGGPRTSNVLIENNKFTGNDDAGIDISNTDFANGVFGLEVATNVFDSNGRGVLFFNTHMSSVHNNSITNSTLATSAAIRLFDNNSDVSFTFNNVDTGTGHGIRLSSGDGPPNPPTASSDVTFHDNNIVNFAGDGLLVDAGSHAGTVDATCNWWGCASGPNTDACETVVGDANFLPWLVAPSPAPVTGPVNCAGGVCQPVPSSIRSNFNGTPIQQNNFIWFNAVLKVKGLGSQPVTIHFNSSTIQFTAGVTPFTLNVPNADVTFSPTATMATTTFNTVTNTWETTVPSGLGGNAFLDGLAFQVPFKFPGGINPVTWNGTFTSATPGITINWQWAAAVYTSFSSNNNADGVKPVDDNQASIYKNSDHAGTPENFKSFVIGGARGGGGANYTGSYSGTTSANCPVR